VLPSCLEGLVGAKHHHPRVERLGVAVLPGPAWFDISPVGANGTNPVSDFLGVGHGET
jgi:hypothetical protein